MRSLILAALIAAGPALAGPCTTHDRWTGPDKKKHLAAGMAIGAAGTLVFKDANKGFLLGVAAGALIETQGVCTLQDFAVTAAGAAAGAYGTGWLILPKKNGVQIAFAKTF